MKRFANILLIILLASFIIILILLPFHAFLSTWGGTAIGPLLIWKSWKEIILIALVPVAVLYLFTNPHVAKVLWSRWINRLILLFIVIISIGCLLSPAGFQAIAAGAMFDLRFLMMFLLAQLLVESKHPFVERLKQYLIPALLGVTFVLGALAFLQVYGLPRDFLVQFGYDKNSSIAPYILVDENQDAIRAFATMRGPNTLGSYLLLPLALALALFIKKRSNHLAWLTLVIGGSALLLTGSRSAWLGAGVMAGITILFTIPAKRLIKISSWLLPMGIATIALVFVLAFTVPAVRLAIFHSSPGDPTLFEGSSEQHWAATAKGIGEVLEQPLGMGVGTAGPASFYGATINLAENYFVQIAQEVGIIGLGIFIAICTALTFRLWQDRMPLWPCVLLASFAGLTVVNVFLHGWADDPTAMTWWAVAGLFMTKPSGKH